MSPPPAPRTRRRRRAAPSRPRDGRQRSAPSSSPSRGPGPEVLAGLVDHLHQARVRVALEDLAGAVVGAVVGDDRSRRRRAPGGGAGWRSMMSASLRTLSAITTRIGRPPSRDPPAATLAPRRPSRRAGTSPAGSRAGSAEPLARAALGATTRRRRADPRGAATRGRGGSALAVGAGDRRPGAADSRARRGDRRRSGRSEPRPRCSSRRRQSRRRSIGRERLRCTPGSGYPATTSAAEPACSSHRSLRAEARGSRRRRRTVAGSSTSSS